MKITILMYHEIDPQPRPEFAHYTVTPHAFSRQLQLLRQLRYTAITPDDLHGYHQCGHPLPKRPVLITFDDGLAGCARYGAPALHAHGFSAVFYLVAGEMDGTSRWLQGEIGIELPMMTWEMARRLERAGFHCGAHSMTHPRLAELPAERCAVELRESRRLLEEQLGHPVRHMAYPHGSYDPQVRQLAAEAGYVTSMAVRRGFSTASDDLLALHRISVDGSDTLLDFAAKLRTTHPLKPAVRLKLQRERTRLKQRFGLPGQ